MGIEVKELESTILKIVNDREHGSSFILKETIDLLEKARKEDRIPVLERIIRAHPSMAGISNLHSILKKKEHTSISDIIRSFKKMENDTIGYLKDIVNGKKIVAISRSHITEMGLLTAKKVLVLVSNPGGEGKKTQKFLDENGIKTELYEDSQMCKAVVESDCVVVGADSISKAGFVNKIGTLPLAICSQFFKKDFLVVAPSYKVGKSYVVAPFEFIPGDLVTGVVWEKGVSKIYEVKFNID